MAEPTPKRFAIQTQGSFPCWKSIPWEMIAPHEAQAMANHGGQTLLRLHERCGLSPCEAVAVLENRRWRPMLPAEAVTRLNELVAEHENSERIGSITDQVKIMRAIRECRLDVDMIGVADACGDIDFTVEGLRQCYGIPRQDVADEVSRSNLEKKGGPVVNGKQMKPEGWRPPDIEGVLRRSGWRP